MKKLRMIALPIMLASCAFIFGGQNVAEANYCLGPDFYCTSDFSCCSKICCRPGDGREPCVFHTSPTNACM